MQQAAALRKRWQKKECINGIFVNSPSNWIAELLARVGFDILTLDLQHSAIAYSDCLSMLQAISQGPSVPFVRLNWNRPEEIMKALDYGFQGLICPMVETPEDTAAFVQAARFPPAGKRSFGPFRSGFLTEGEYVKTADREAICFAMIETAAALENLEAIAATPGLDGLFIGPTDLSISMGLPKKADLKDPKLLEAIDRVLSACHRNDLIPGIFTLIPWEIKAMREKGFQFISFSNDNLLLLQKMEETKRLFL